MKLKTNLLQAILIALVLFQLQACKTSSTTTSRPTGSRPTIGTGSPKPEQPAPPRTTTSRAAAKAPQIYREIDLNLGPAPREFRGVWIATVANIDWPTSSTATFEKQKEEFTKLLDYYHGMNFNAVIVQIRTSGDAFYPSRYSPWSRYLTGKEGQKPNTTEDPLSWMILEAHRRGMEFHAWLNPYRATMDLDLNKLSPEHDIKKHPNWMIKYATKYYYNPGLPEVRAHLVNIIREVVQNYNIDAIHFDDYFYPYKVDKQVFDDAATFKKYGKPGQKLDDWRRENVNMLVREVHQTIKGEKPYVQFGISPFGVWRNKDRDPNGSNTRAGTNNYDDLYADVLTWMKNGWIDYLIPQLYWSMDYNLASYRELVNWWSKNSYNTKIYIGNGPYKIRDNADKAWDNPMEIPTQVGLAKVTPNIAGNAYFSARSFYVKNRDVADLLVKNHYIHPVLPPEMHKVVASNPTLSKPILIQHGEGYAIQFDQVLHPDYRFALIYAAPTLDDLRTKGSRAGFQKVYLDDSNRLLIPVLSHHSQKYIAFSLLDRYGKETRPMVFEIQTLP
jgi:uncharacterized lipoprotein YddW (UPF0748 family)